LFKFEAAGNYQQGDLKPQDTPKKTMLPQKQNRPKNPSF